MMMDKIQKLVFFGTPDFAVPTLKALNDKEFNICLIITQKDKPVGRRQILTPSPIKVEAEKFGLKIIDSLIIKEIMRIKPDIGVVAAYGALIPQKILDLFPRGILNIHPSLLPKWRGPSPIQSAILSGSAETGVSIIKLDKKMDHGPKLVSKILKIEPDDNYQSLSKKLADLGAKMLIEILPDYLAGEIKPEPQNDDEATYCKMISKNNGLLDFNKSAIELERQIKAYAPWPGCFAEFAVKNKKIIIKIIAAKAYNSAVAQHAAQPRNNNQPRNVEFIIINEQLHINCGHGALFISKLQIEGKKEITAQEFINGYIK